MYNLMISEIFSLKKQTNANQTSRNPSKKPMDRPRQKSNFAQFIDDNKDGSNPLHYYNGLYEADS